MLWRDTNPALHAICLVTLGYSIFAFSDAITKWLTAGYGMSQILATSSFVGLFVTGTWIVRKKGWQGFKSPRLRWHIYRGICVSLISLSVVQAVSLTPLADFYAIIFLSPLTVLILSYFFLGEPIGAHRALAVITGFLGVLVLVGPQFGHLNLGIIITFMCMSFVSISVILIRKVGQDYLPLYGFYPALIIFTINAPMAVMEFTMPDLQGAIMFMLYAPLILMGQLILSVGFARAPETSVVTPFHYIQMLWGVILGYFLFSEVPSLATLAGSSLIIGSGLYLIWREHKLHKKKSVFENTAV